MKRILCFGDSLTYGFTSRPCMQGLPPARLDENTRWTMLLEQKLGEGYRIVEAGMPGRTTVFEDETHAGRSGIAALDIVFESADPLDLVIIMLGTNDLRGQFGTNASVIGFGLERIIIRLKQLIATSLNPDCKILVLAPPKIIKVPDAFILYEPEWIAERDKLPMNFQRVCGMYGCEFADTADWVEPDFCDGIHIPPEGNISFVEHLLPIVKSILK